MPEQFATKSERQDARIALFCASVSCWACTPPAASASPTPETAIVRAAIRHSKVRMENIRPSFISLRPAAYDSLRHRAGWFQALNRRAEGQHDGA
jgi:hypothetical protein